MATAELLARLKPLFASHQVGAVLVLLETGEILPFWCEADAFDWADEKAMRHGTYSVISSQTYASIEDIL